MIYCVDSLGDIVHALEDGDWERVESARGRELFLIGQKMLDQGKVDGKHCVGLVVRVPH